MSSEEARTKSRFSFFPEEDPADLHCSLFPRSIQPFCVPVCRVFRTMMHTIDALSLSVRIHQNVIDIHTRTGMTHITKNHKLKVLYPQ
jgi:hypothetical protein